MRDVAGCVIRNDDGDILLLRRVSGDHAQWEMPGGKVESNETPENAAGREVHEELGVQVTIGVKLGQAAFEFDGQEWLYHWFEAKIISGDPQIMEPTKFDQLRYFSLEQMKSDISMMSPNIVNVLNHLK